MRTTPSRFVKESFAEETSHAFVALITIGHIELAAPIRITTDSKDTVSRGIEFIAYPVEVSLPADEHGRAPTATLRIDNVDRDITAALVSITTPATVWIEMVLSGAPDEIVALYAEFRLTKGSYDANVVEGELTLKDFGREPYPAWTYGPVRFPSMYRNF